MIGDREGGTHGSDPTCYRHWSLRVVEPLSDVVNELLGSDSHVTWPLFLRMYLYSMTVLAGSETVTDSSSVSMKRSKQGRGVLTAPGGVVSGGEEECAVGRPVLERSLVTGEVDVLCESRVLFQYQPAPAGRRDSHRQG